MRQLQCVAGYPFSEGDVELPCYIDLLRNREKVDLVVMISELELARDIKLIEANAGMDVVLNSDMHEKTIRPIAVHQAGAAVTLLVEEGQDGTMLGELRVQVVDGKLKSWQWTPHVIPNAIPADKMIAAKVAEARRPFLKGTFVPDQTVTVGGSTTTLLRPVDEVIAYSQIDMHRSSFMDETMPAVVEGSSHDLILDTMRWALPAQKLPPSGDFAMEPRFEPVKPLSWRTSTITFRWRPNSGDLETPTWPT